MTKHHDMTNNLTITICHYDQKADDYPWFIKENGQQVGRVLDVELSDATDTALRDALRSEFPRSYGHLSNESIDIAR